MNKTLIYLGVGALILYLINKNQASAAPVNPCGAGYSPFNASDGKTYCAPDSESVVRFVA